MDEEKSKEEIMANDIIRWLEANGLDFISEGDDINSGWELMMENLGDYVTVKLL